MFTGLVREVGEVESVDRGDDGARLRVRADLSGELTPGDSVAVSGVCLTVAGRGDGAFEADVMNQTLALTTLGERGEGDGVNLEPALRAGEPMGGHLVQGHVDGVGEVVANVQDGFARRLRIAVPSDQRRYLAERGSVTVDGVSLTVAAITDDGFEVSLIPETLERTTLAGASRVNLELDIVARYVERLVGFREEPNETDG
jgi:riboflavin synthase